MENFGGLFDMAVASNFIGHDEDRDYTVGFAAMPRYFRREISADLEMVPLPRRVTSIESIGHRCLSCDEEILYPVASAT